MRLVARSFQARVCGVNNEVLCRSGLWRAGKIDAMRWMTPLIVQDKWQIDWLSMFWSTLSLKFEQGWPCGARCIRMIPCMHHVHVNKSR